MRKASKTLCYGIFFQPYSKSCAISDVGQDLEKVISGIKIRQHLILHTVEYQINRRYVNWIKKVVFPISFSNEVTVLASSIEEVGGKFIKRGCRDDFINVSRKWVSFIELSLWVPGLLTINVFCVFLIIFTRYCLLVLRKGAYL